MDLTVCWCCKKQKWNRKPLTFLLLLFLGFNIPLLLFRVFLHVDFFYQFLKLARQDDIAQTSPMMTFSNRQEAVKITICKEALFCGQNKQHERNKPPCLVVSLENYMTFFQLKGVASRYNFTRLAFVSTWNHSLFKQEARDRMLWYLVFTNCLSVV